MPKIPTIKATARMTAETPGAISNIQVSPTQTLAGALDPIREYAVAQRNLSDKQEAQSLYLESQAEINQAEKEASSMSNLEQAKINFNTRVQQIKNNYVQRTSTRNSKTMFDNMFNLDVLERDPKISKSIRDNQIIKFGEGWKTRYQQTLAEWDLSVGEDRNLKTVKLDNLIREKNSFTRGGDAELTKDLNAHNGTLVEMDIYRSLRNNNFKEASSILSDSEKVKFLDPDKRNTLLNKVSKAAKAYSEKNFEQNATTAIANSNFADLGKLSDIALPSTGDAQKDASNKTKFKSIIEKSQKLIEKEGAAEFYVNNDANLYQLNSSFNQVYGKAIQTVSSSLTTNEEKDAAIQAANDSFNDYATQAKQKYEMLNVPQSSRTLLTNAAITNLKQRIEGATNSDQKLRVIQEVKTIYGEHTPMIMKQIKNQISPSVAFAMSVEDPDLKVSAAQGPISEDDKKIFNSKLKDKMANAEIEIAKTVRDELEPFTQIVLRQGNIKFNASQIVDDIALNVSTAVQRKVINTIEPLSSSDVTKIAKQYTKNFMSDYDLTNDTYWIPTKIGNQSVNQGFVEAKVELFKTALKYDQIDFSKIDIRPVGDGKGYKSREETLDFFKKNGDFYLKSNDQIVFGVKDDNGLIREFMYSSLADDYDTKKTYKQYKPLTFKFLDNSDDIGDFDKLDMEAIYTYMSTMYPDIPEEAMMP